MVMTKLLGPRPWVTLSHCPWFFTSINMSSNCGFTEPFSHDTSLPPFHHHSPSSLLQTIPKSPQPFMYFTLPTQPHLPYYSPGPPPYLVQQWSPVPSTQFYYPPISSLYLQSAVNYVQHSTTELHSKARYLIQFFYPSFSTVANILFII